MGKRCNKIPARLCYWHDQNWERDVKGIMVHPEETPLSISRPARRY